MNALQKIIAEAKSLKKKFPNRFATWKEYVSQASAIYASKHKGKSPVGKKKKTIGKTGEYHKDTKSHNVNIKVVSGLKKDLQIDETIIYKGYKIRKDEEGYTIRDPKGYDPIGEYLDTLKEAKKIIDKDIVYNKIGFNDTLKNLMLQLKDEQSIMKRQIERLKTSKNISEKKYNTDSVNRTKKRIKDIMKKISKSKISGWRKGKSKFIEKGEKTAKRNTIKVTRSKGQFAKFRSINGLSSKVRAVGMVYGIITGSKYSKLAQQLIIDNIQTEGYGVKANTDIQKIKFLKDTFKSEAGWKVPRMGMQMAVEDWLRGLPSTLTLPFENYEIINIAKEWGSLPQNATEKQKDKILDNYWRLMSANVVKLFNKVK